MNAVMDEYFRSVEAHACCRLSSFGAVDQRRASRTRTHEMFEGSVVIKRKTLSDGRVQLILKDPTTGVYHDRVI